MTGAEFSSIAASMDDRWVIVNGVAKAYAMPGWRVGWMVGPPDVIKAASGFQSHSTSNVCNVAQHAALAALSGPQESVSEMKAAFDRRRLAMYEGLSNIAGMECIMPQGAFYAFPNCSGLPGTQPRRPEGEQHHRVGFGHPGGDQGGDSARGGVRRSRLRSFLLCPLRPRPGQGNPAPRRLLGIGGSSKNRRG